MVSDGKVIFVSSNGGMLVVQHADGFAVVELLGDEGTVSEGDILSGDWDSVGGETISNGIQRLHVYLQGSWGSRDDAITVARQTGGS